jgi:hypothetical protein
LLDDVAAQNPDILFATDDKDSLTVRTILIEGESHALFTMIPFLYASYQTMEMGF